MKTNRFEFKNAKQVKEQLRAPSDSRSWRGAWNRPMVMDEGTQHPFTVARMTDHNVRGVDEGSSERSMDSTADKKAA